MPSVNDIVTIRDLVTINIDQGLLSGTFDYALPMPWVYDLHNVIGEWPVEFVWSYPPRSIFGQPFPLTDAARDQLRRYNAARGITQEASA